MIVVPRYLLLGLAALFSAYHVLLGTQALAVPAHPAPVVPALVLYAASTAVSVWPRSPRVMSRALAFANLVVCVAVPLLVTGELDPTRQNGYGTWYVAAVGTLMTITAVRGRVLAAWLGVAFLVVQTLVWGGIGDLIRLGVIGSVMWVAIAVVITRALAKAARDARTFAGAEREAAAWQAAQEAHVFERQLRLQHTYRMAAPMLAEIARSGGELSEADRAECRHLEGAIRDEIRGRRLLDDEVRAEVLAARRRESTVSLLDEGGIDDLDEQEVRAVRHRLAAAIRANGSDKLIVRTVPRSSETAVTVVGLRTNGGEDEDDEVELWLEIPRPGAT